MARKDLSKIDSSEYERSRLEYVLEEERKEKDDTVYLSVEEAMKGDSVYEANSHRDITRVLFISQDESLLNPSQQSLDGYVNLADLFDEVHILILREGIVAKNPALRVDRNVWIYTAGNKNWWWTPVMGKLLIENQLVFADGFRPDIIVARDPYESALLAINIGKKYGRPVQIHVLEDYTKSEFLKKNRHNRWRKYLPRFTIPRVESVRTSTRPLYEFIVKRFPVKDVSILPRFNNYESLISVKSSLDLRAKYKPFVFIILYIGKLTHSSYLYRAIDAARFGLRNPHFGMIVIGDGPAKKEFEERAKILDIKEQVVFAGDIKDYVPYLKSANVLIVPDIDPESEEVVIKGAAAGIPMILARTPIREDIFTDGDSALLCVPEEVDEFSLKLNILMNDLPLRRHIVESAQDMIKSKFHDDTDLYKAAYRKSIEDVLFLDEKNIDTQENEDESI
jgi:glycosyltransferase involved in cell wall biosynthesis